MSQPHYTPRAAHRDFCLPAKQDDDALFVRGATGGPRREKKAALHVQTEEVTCAKQHADLRIIHSLPRPLSVGEYFPLQTGNEGPFTFSWTPVKSRHEPLDFGHLCVVFVTLLSCVSRASSQLISPCRDFSPDCAISYRQNDKLSSHPPHPPWTSK